MVEGEQTTTRAEAQITTNQIILDTTPTSDNVPARRNIVCNPFLLGGTRNAGWIAARASMCSILINAWRLL